MKVMQRADIVLIFFVGIFTVSTIFMIFKSISIHHKMKREPNKSRKEMLKIDRDIAICNMLETLSILVISMLFKFILWGVVDNVFC